MGAERERAREERGGAGELHEAGDADGASQELERERHRPSLRRPSPEVRSAPRTPVVRETLRPAHLLEACRGTIGTELAQFDHTLTGFGVRHRSAAMASWIASRPPSVGPRGAATYDAAASRASLTSRSASSLCSRRTCV